MKKRYIDVEKLLEDLRQFENENTNVAVAGISVYCYPKQSQIYNNERGFGYFNTPVDNYLVELEEQEEEHIVEAVE